MSEQEIEVGIVIVRRHAGGPWGEEMLVPHCILPDAPDLPEGSSLDGGRGQMIYAGAARLELHRAETAHYRDNLCAARPAIWVALRMEGEACRLHSATLDPYEGEALAETLNVEALPMPASIAALLAEFVARHHVERPFIKRKRDRTGRREQGLED